MRGPERPPEGLKGALRGIRDQRDSIALHNEVLNHPKKG
jgi:hypothetical protein